MSKNKYILFCKLLIKHNNLFNVLCHETNYIFIEISGTEYNIELTESYIRFLKGSYLFTYVNYVNLEDIIFKFPEETQNVFIYNLDLFK